MKGEWERRRRLTLEEDRRSLEIAHRDPELHALKVRVADDMVGSGVCPALKLVESALGTTELSQAD